MTDVNLTEWLWSSITPDVVILRWPEYADEARRLDRIGVAHLLLVEPDATAPEIDSCVGDWIRLPTNEDDVRARLVALRHRSQRHPTIPTIDSYGQLSYLGRSLFLSPIEQRLMELFARHFGTIVTKSDLLAVWPGGGSPSALRVHIGRLRKQLGPIGLTIESRRTTGYVMRAYEPSASPQRDE
jgi:hypothetical protein